MTESPTRITVIGAGAMGSAIARTLVDVGHPTAVWNRTPERAQPLADRGVAVAATVRDAFESAELVLISLLDATAVRAVLDDAGSAVAGRIVVDLTSTTPDDAASVFAAIEALGGRPLSGAVMATPPLVGTEHMLVLYSGEQTLFEKVRPALMALGENAVHVGPRPGDAAVLDLAMLDVFYAAVTAFVHGAALVARSGLSAREYLPYLQPILELTAATFEELAAEIDAGHHPGDDNNLTMMLRGIEHVVEASESAGIDSSVPDVTRRLMQRAVDAGHGSDGYGRLFDVVGAPG